MNEELFQIIFDKLQEVVPAKWRKMVFYAGYTEGSYSMKYYIDMGTGKYIDCFSLGTISDMELVRLFASIDKEIVIEREQLDHSKRWNVLTMIVDSEGNFKTDFDYNDISENLISYQKEWRNRYLK